MMGGIFYNMKALFVMDDLECKERYQRIVYAGGGDWLNDSLVGAMGRRVDGRSLTHIFIDPWVLDKEEGRDRYYDFQDWLDYEKSVSRKSSDSRDGPRWQNAGVLFKLHFTFLIDKLLKPGDNISWMKYRIFDKKVQDLALKRRTWRKKWKVKLEQEKWKREQKNDFGEDNSDEEDLETVKQRLIQRNRKEAPGRFYVEKNRGSAICEEEARLEARAGRHGGVKRKTEGSDEMVDRLGYMESTKRKNKRSAGSYIKADPAKHIKQDGVVDTDKLFEDHHSAPLESLQSNYIRNINSEMQKIMNSHPLNNRPKGFTDNNWWNNRHQRQKDWSQHSGPIKREVKPEFKRERLSFPAKFESQEEIVLDSDSGSDIEILDETNPSLVQTKNVSTALVEDIDEFNLPPGIIIKPREVSLDDEDDIVCLSNEEGEDADVKPALKDLVASLGGIPDVIQCYSDSEEEQEVVEEVFTTREESMDTENTETMPVALPQTPNLALGFGGTSEPEPVEIPPMPSTTESDGNNLLENENVQVDSVEHMATEISVSTNNDLNEVSVSLPSLKESSEGVKEQQSVLQETTLESIVSDDGQEASVTTSAPATSNYISYPLPQETDLLHHLNATILKRQEEIKDHLVIGNIATPVLHYRSVADKGQSQTVKLHPTDGHVVNEFSEYGSYQEQEVRTKRGRKKKTGSAGSETSVVSDDGKLNVGKLFSSLRYLSAYLTSQTLIKPEILNVIWKIFFLDSNEVLLHLKAEDLLQMYFMLFPWSKGANRLVLMDSVLSSLRDVSDQSMFSKFERENSRDLSDVVSFVEDIIEKCSTENVNQGAIQLLNILVKVFKRDFIQWWKDEKWKGNFPLIYYVMGGNSSNRNMLKMVEKLYRIQTVILRKLAREVLSLTAMLAAFLDQKEKEDYIHQGFKMELAEVIANILDEVKDPITIFVECSLLQPSWLSLLVSKCLLNVHQPSKKTPRLCEISSMMKGLSLGDDARSSYLSENIQYRLVCMSQSHLLLRANWFFTSNKEQKTKFEVFNKMKELSENNRSKKRDVTFKSLVKVSLARQTQDLKTISDIARGIREVGGEPGGAERALMFVMTGEHDLGWHPGIP